MVTSKDAHCNPSTVVENRTGLGVQLVEAKVPYESVRAYH